MKLHQINVEDLDRATLIANNRRRLLMILGEDRCALHGIGPFLDEGAVAAVLPAYRAWLVERIGTLTEGLTNMGLSVTDPDHPMDDLMTNTQTYRSLDGSADKVLISRSLTEVEAACLRDALRKSVDERITGMVVEGDTKGVPSALAELAIRVDVLEGRFGATAAAD